jgi:ADP-ribosylglycohydrolase
MPTQLLSRHAIHARWGPILTGFEDAPDDHPIAAGMKAGRVTDDTEQAALLAEHLISGKGHIEPHEWAHALLTWEADMSARGSLDLLGPSTRRAVRDVAAGVPVEESGRFGDTNGAAMRIAPVGIATPMEDLDLLVDRVVEASMVTHNTGVALAGAAAVAAAVSVAISGADLAEAIETAIQAATTAATRGHWIAGADVATRIRWATDLVAGLSPEASAEIIYALVGTAVATQESVPAAFAVLAVCGNDPWLACRTAASLGGDCDTVAAMVGAVSGAMSGLDGLPAEAVELIEARNDLHLESLATELLKLRT